MIQSEGLVKRKNIPPEIPESPDDIGEQTEHEDCDPNTNISELSLMEEVFLLGLKDKEGTVSFWNDTLSVGLRGCILVELGLQGRIELEKPKFGRRSLLTRLVLLKNANPIGDILLDEALKHIAKAAPPKNVDSWIRYLSGETWNPLKLKYQMKTVQNRIAKNLVEKGVLSTEMKTYMLFDVTVYPLIDPIVKNKVIKKIIDVLLLKWKNDSQKIDKKDLALVFLANASDVLENAIRCLDNTDYSIVSKRLKELHDLDYETECTKENSTSDILWAVFAYFR